MFSIGELSKRTGVKVPTIRYYEQSGLLPEPHRTDGNQRRYSSAGLERLSFIKHARELGFSIDAISSLIELEENPDHSCDRATEIAQEQLTSVREKLRKLKSLEGELKRVADGCNGKGISKDCYVLASLGDHRLCRSTH
jgi:DNA-binding transcriptional MerR regulator